MATALSVHQAGHEVTLLERYHQARPAGNILNLWPPPIKALALLGVDTTDLGAPCRTEFRGVDGHVRARVNLPCEIVDEYGGGFIGLLRPGLYERLLAALPAGVLRVDRPVVSLEQDETGVRDGFQWWTLGAWDAGTEFTGDWHMTATGMKRFRTPLPELVAATEPANVQQWVLRDRKPLKRWSKGRATIVGDAAHPTSPYAATVRAWPPRTGTSSAAGSRAWTCPTTPPCVRRLTYSSGRASRTPRGRSSWPTRSVRPVRGSPGASR